MNRRKFSIALSFIFYLLKSGNLGWRERKSRVARSDRVLRWDNLLEKVFIATVSEKWIVDKDTVRYPMKTGFQLEKCLRLHEQPGPDWHTYPWNSRRTCRNYFLSYLLSLSASMSTSSFLNLFMIYLA